MINKNFMAEAINDRLFLATANPGYLISVAEQGVKDTAIKMGCREYWRYWPFRVRLAKTYGTQQTTTVINFSEIWASGEPRIDEEQQKHAYILGITRGNLPSWNMRSNPKTDHTHTSGFLAITEDRLHTKLMKIFLTVKCNTILIWPLKRFIFWLHSV